MNSVLYVSHFLESSLEFYDRLIICALLLWIFSYLLSLDYLNSKHASRFFYYSMKYLEVCIKSIKNGFSIMKIKKITYFEKEVFYFYLGFENPFQTG